MALVGWSLKQAARVLGLPEEKIESLVRRGIVSATRNESGQVTLGFTQLVLLQTAARLFKEKQSWRVIEKALRKQALDMEGLESEQQFKFQFGAPARVQPLLVHSSSVPTKLEPETMNAAEWYVLGQRVEEDSAASARDAYRRALELDPIHQVARWALSEVLAGEDRVDAAERHLRLLEIQSPTAEVAAGRGRLLFDLDRYDEAEASLKRAVQLDPDSGSSWLLLGRLYEIQGRRQDALRSLSEFKRLTDQPSS